MKISKLIAAATRGPWRADGIGNIHNEDGIPVAKLIMAHDYYQLIVALVNSAPALVEQVKKARRLQQLANELCVAIERAEDDIGGSRSTAEILADLGPATDEAEEALAALPAEWQGER